MRFSCDGELSKFQSSLLCGSSGTVHGSDSGSGSGVVVSSFGAGL